METGTDSETPTTRLDLPETPQWLDELARQMLKQPLPPGWSEELGYQGQTYFFHKVTGDTSSSHPQLGLFRSIIEEAMSWPADATREDVAKRCQQRLDLAYQTAKEELAQWSGPYCMEAGRRTDRPMLGVDFRDLYYYNESTGESSWVDPRAALQFDLQQRRQLTYLCLALYRPSSQPNCSQASSACGTGDTPQIQVIAPSEPQERSACAKPALLLPLRRRERRERRDSHQLEAKLQPTSPCRSSTRVGDDSCRSHASYYSATSTCSDEAPVAVGA